MIRKYNTDMKDSAGTFNRWIDYEIRQLQKRRENSESTKRSVSSPAPR